MSERNLTPEETARLLEERTEEVARLTERLNQLEQSQNDLVSMVSHELRTPLATIKEFTSIIADGLAGPTSPTQEEYLKIVQANVERLARMINDLLDLAKAEAGHVDWSRRAFVDAGTLVSHVVASLTPFAQSKKVRLVSEGPAGGLGVFADADRITQVLVNLIDNAIKFTPEGGRVTIAVSELPNEVQFQVRDTGSGIEPEHVPKLFQKFAQFRQSKSPRKGAGLGLAISKRFVELHGGRIWADSRPGEGSTFAFTLPKYHPEEVFMDCLRTGIQQAKEQHTTFSIIMLSVTEFAGLKARYGPAEAANLLRAIETIIQRTIRRRAGDVVIHWQRGEIIVVLAQVDKTGCDAIAERVERAVTAQPYRLKNADERISIVTSSATYPDEALDADALIEAAQRRLQSVSRPKMRLLVVDDEPKIRRLLKETLELRDFEVQTAASGPEALAQLSERRFDAILLDVMMPVMDGYEVYHLLRENPRTKDVPVLMVTAKGERTDRLLGMDSPTYNYVMKPFEIDEVVAKLQGMLQQSSAS